VSGVGMMSSVNAAWPGCGPTSQGPRRRRCGPALLGVAPAQELLEECGQLRDAGRTAQAKRALAVAEKLLQRLTQLERAVRRPRNERG
jgi:hypothetical protein